MRFIWWVCAFLASVTALFAGEMPAWPHEHSDLKPAPHVTFGRLENGFRYMILPHANPVGRVTLHLLVDVGSYQEDDEERGLAHFIEHMVFNGSRDFPGDETIETLQRLGLNFGPEVNAFTSMLETRYHLENLPSTDPAALPTGLKILRNFADGALFAENAVRKESKVILAEKRSREGAMAFAWRRELEFLPPYGDEYAAEEINAVFSKTRIESHLNPMGLQRTISTATPKQLRAFYNRWYRPERMILAVVGDIEPGTVEKQIIEAFATLRARTPAPKLPLIAKPAVFTGEKVHVFANINTSLPQTHLTIGTALGRDTTDSSIRRASELRGRFVLSLVAQRLERSLKLPVAVRALTNHAIPGWQLPLLRIITPTQHWKLASIAMLTEVRRAQQYGFSAEEIEQEINSYQRVLVEDERDEPNRSASELAQALVFSAARGIVFTDTTSDRQLGEAALATITPTVCLDAAGQLWSTANTSLSVWGPIENDGLQDLSDTLSKAWSAKLEPYDRSVVKPFPYTNFGPAGVITSQRHDEALDCWFVQLANGVRLNFKSTKFEVGLVKVSVRFGYGSLGSAQKGIGMAIGALVLGGLPELPLEEFGATFKKMGAHIENFNFSWAPDCFKFSEDLDDKNLPLGLQIITAFLSAPGFRESADPNMRAKFEPQLVAQEQIASEAADAAMRGLLSSQNPATLLPTVAESRTLSYATLCDSIKPQLLNSPLEVTLVGDISLEEAIAVVAQTLGALPSRPTDDALGSRRNYTPPVLPFSKTIKFNGNKSVGSVALAWTMLDETGQHDDCAFTLLKTILDDRLRLTLRKEMGETYTPDVQLWSLNYLTPSTLTLRARIETSPQHVERVSKAMRKVVAQLAREGVTMDELERARQPNIQTLQNDQATNQWWLNTLAEAQSKPQFLSGATEQLQFYRTITREEINTLARTLLVNGRCCEVRAVPE
jgi:zinc protease